MVGRLLALFAVLATVIAAASVPLLRAGQYAPGKPISRLLPKEDDDYDEIDDTEEDKPSANTKAMEDNTNAPKLIPDDMVYSPNMKAESCIRDTDMASAGDDDPEDVNYSQIYGITQMAIWIK